MNNLLSSPSVLTDYVIIVEHLSTLDILEKDGLISGGEVILM